jgi:hypothetical protein
MADYRLYSLDGDGRISLADWIQADSDEEAIAVARQMRPGALECEVWLKNRLVATMGSAKALAAQERQREG